VQRTTIKRAAQWDVGAQLSGQILNCVQDTSSPIRRLCGRGGVGGSFSSSLPYPLNTPPLGGKSSRSIFKCGVSGWAGSLSRSEVDRSGLGSVVDGSRPAV